MHLIQATLLAGYVLFWVFIILVIIGTLLLTPVIMKIHWRRLGKEELIRNKTPYYKDPVFYVLALILSLLVVGGVLFALFQYIFQLLNNS
jgi:hypothetical protein